MSEPGTPSADLATEIDAALEGVYRKLEAERPPPSEVEDIVDWVRRNPEPRRVEEWAAVRRRCLGA